MKFHIIPRKIDDIIEACDKEEALLKFTENMTSDMHCYFEAVPDDEYPYRLMLDRYEEQKKSVQDFMRNVLESDFDICTDNSDGLVNKAYEYYIKASNDCTQYDAVKLAYDDAEEEIINAAKEVERHKDFHGDLELHLSRDAIEIREYVEEEMQAFVRKTVPSYGFSEKSVLEICNNNAWFYEG